MTQENKGQENRGPVTNCVHCDRWVAGTGPTLCEQCQAEGHRMCANCQKRVTNETTPYCDICAEEIVGTG
jgi:predicted amidophosphoribosyltransferase